MDSDAGIGCFIVVALWICAIYSIIYLIYVFTIWLAEFGVLFPMFFYGCSAILIFLSIRWRSKANRLEQEQKMREESYRSLQNTLLELQNTLSMIRKK